MESAGSDEQDVICLYRAVLRVNDASFNDRKDVPLNSLSRHVGSVIVVAVRDLIDLIYEHDPVLLGILECLVSDLIHVQKILSLLLAQDPSRVLYSDLLGLLLLRHHTVEDVSDSDAHALVTYIELVPHRLIVYLDLDELILEKPTPELLSNLFSRELCLLSLLYFFLVLLLILLLSHVSVHKHVERSLLDLLVRLLRARDYSFKYLLLGEHVGDIVLLLHVLVLCEPERSLHEVPDHRIHVAAYISDLSEFRRLDLYERSLHEFREPSRDLCLSASCRSHHEDVLRRDLFPHLI